MPVSLQSSCAYLFMECKTSVLGSSLICTHKACVGHRLPVKMPNIQLTQENLHAPVPT